MPLLQHWDQNEDLDIATQDQSGFTQQIQIRRGHEHLSKTPVLMAPCVSPSYSSNFLVDSTLVFSEVRTLATEEKGD